MVYGSQVNTNTNSKMYTISVSFINNVQGLKNLIFSIIRDQITQQWFSIHETY